MKTNKTYVFVPKSVYKHFFNRCYNLLIPLKEELKKIGINAILYPIGSGERHLVTRLVINDEFQPFDLDFNLEINLLTLPKKYRNLKELKNIIIVNLNKITENRDFFSNSQDSTSVISVPLHFKNSKKIKFSFDLAIVSRNTYGNLQRLIHDKKNENFIWTPAKNSKDFKKKAEKLKTPQLWNQVRKHYLNLKNQFINDCHHPSFVCYIMAINEVYNQNCIKKK